jgi:integrase
MYNYTKSKKSSPEYQGFVGTRKHFPNPVSATKKPVNNLNKDIYGHFLSNHRDSSGTQSFFEGADTQVSSPKKKMTFSNSKIYEANVRAYTPARLVKGNEWFISFYAFDPTKGEMRRKRIKLNRIKNSRQRKEYAEDLISRLNSALINGYNPWINLASENSYTTFEDAIAAYRRYLDRLLQDDHIRERTMKGYYSMSKILLDFNNSQKTVKKYIYQMNVDFVNRFIDWIWLEQGLSGTTRDNYVLWIKGLTKWLQGKQYIEGDPSAGLVLLGKKKGKKNRSIIKESDMERLKDYVEPRNKHFLLACYILYYCFVRPKEMSYIQLKHVSIKRGTLFIPDYSSKNRKDGTVTLPDKVIKLMIDLDIFRNHDDYFLFGKNMKPGLKKHSNKQFTDYWAQYIRPALKFPETYKFYSLKDTGITDLIKSNTDLLAVRDQARHSTLLMTDIYTPHDIEEANELIKHHEGIF